MDYGLSFPSLENLALVQVASDLFNASVSSIGLSKLITAKRGARYRRRKWNILGLELSSRLNSTLLPQKLKILVWLVLRKLYFSVCHYYYYDIPKCFPNKREFVKFLKMEWSISPTFSFTATGGVRKNKLLEAHIERSLKVDTTNFKFRRWYRLACEFCLVDYIRSLWSRMDEDDRVWACQSNENLLLNFWSHIVHQRGDFSEAVNLSDYNCFYQSNSDNFNFFMWYSMHSGNGVAAEYFWTKLTDSKKASMAWKCAQFAVRFRNTDLLCSTLMYLREEERVHLLNEQSTDVLDCFLQWPYYDYFYPSFKQMQSCLDIWSYTCFFQKIVEQVPEISDTHNPYQIILHQFCSKIPVEMKREMHHKLECKEILSPYLWLLKV